MMTIQFRLLGRIEAQINENPVDLGHARQRCVLAALLINANRTVQVGQLVDRVWADRPPQRARGALNSYLSRLRQVLDGAATIELARGCGYRITVQPEAVDLHRFKSLVQQARKAAPAPAASLYKQA